MSAGLRTATLLLAALKAVRGVGGVARVQAEGGALVATEEVRLG